MYDIQMYIESCIGQNHGL